MGLSYRHARQWGCAVALATRCPDCGTIFRISTIQAAAKSGMVRCGACRHVFNSLDALVRVEDLEPEPDTQNETSAIMRDAGEVGDAPIAAVGLPAATSDERSLASQNAQIEAHRAVFEDWPPTPDHGPQERVVDSPADTAHQGADDGAHDGPHDDSPIRIGTRRLDLDWPQVEPAADPAAEPTFMRSAERPARSAAERAVIGILSSIAVFVLIAQAAYVWRDELAARWPVVKPALAAACVPLRCVVALPARLDAIKIVSSSLQNTPGNRDVYVATLLLRNYADVDVRLPAIEMTLTDTQERPLVRRVFRPGDYVTRESAARRGGEDYGVAADSELPVRIVFEAAGLRVAGFYFDRFYP